MRQAIALCALVALTPAASADNTGIGQAYLDLRRIYVKPSPPPPPQQPKEEYRVRRARKPEENQPIMDWRRKYADKVCDSIQLGLADRKMLDVKNWSKRDWLDMKIAFNKSFPDINFDMVWGYFQIQLDDASRDAGMINWDPVESINRSANFSNSIRGRVPWE